MSEQDHVVPSEPKRRQHIRPRKADETVCTLTGQSPSAVAGSRTSRVVAEIECAQCRVGTDLLLETGDLLVNAEGRWEMDDRPEEFRSVNHFIAYLGEDERRSFTLSELQELVRLTKQPYRWTLGELRRLGFRLSPPPVEREVRGVGRAKVKKSED